MSRYRPPRPKGSPYITLAGQQALQQELTYLWKEKRPDVTRRVSAAAAMGDRSENAEYIYGKRQLREIDARIAFLSKRLDELTIVDRTPSDPSRVFFGAWVTLRQDNETPTTYRIVGCDEIDPHQQHISIDAPLARALIGKEVGDEVALLVQLDTTAPRILDPDREDEEHVYTITAIDYKK